MPKEKIKDGKKYIIEDGKEKVIIPCPFCGNELKFSLEPRGRRLHCMCLKCNKKLELTIE